MNTHRFFVLALIGFGLARAVQGDQIEMVNGDRFTGKVVGISDQDVRVDSEITGPIRLPRDKVSVIWFQPKPSLAAITNQAKAVLPGTVSAKGNIDPRAVEQVQQEFLANATPEATAMFNKMIKGYMTGSLSVQDIRGEAQKAMKEMKNLQQELGEEAGGLFEGYFGILEKFLQETEPKPGATPKTPVK